MKQIPVFLLCAASAVTGTLLGTWLYGRLVPKAPEKLPEPPPASPNAEALQNEFVTVLRRAMPAVVSIAAEPHAGAAGRDHRKAGENLPDRCGTGFLISKDGYIVTGETVIRNAQNFFVTDSGGHEYPAQYAGADPATGLAVLKISGRNDFPVLRFARNEELQLGQWVLAPGSTVSAGLLAALPGPGKIQIQNGSLLTTIVPPQGSTGGPLTGIHGRVIGVLRGGVPGGSSAVSADLVREITEELIRSGSIKRPWLGLLVSGSSAGIQVHAAAPHSPAEDSLEPGDVILAAGGKSVRSAYDLQTLLMRTGAGNEIELTIRRKERTLTGKLRIGISPANWFRELQYPAGIAALAL